MSERVTSLALSAFLFVVVVAMSWMAVDFGDEARRVPLAVGIPTSLFLGLQLARELLALRLGPQVSDAKEAEAAAEAEEQTGEEEQADRDEDGEADGSRSKSPALTLDQEMEARDMRASAAQAFGWVLLLAISFYVMGMLLTVPVFMGAFMRVYGHETWKTIVLFIVVTVAVLHAFFVLLLEVQLYTGIVGERLGL